jgi:hypothetical protein
MLSSANESARTDARLPLALSTVIDRLSRFSKLGGEKVPHTRFEETLYDLAGSAEKVFAAKEIDTQRTTDPTNAR